MKMHRGFAAILFATGVLLAHPALSSDEETLPSTIRVGALEVHPQLMISETWKDNVFATRDDEKSDFITTITPGIALKLPFRSHQIGLGASAEFARYADFTELDSDSYKADALGEFNIGERVNLKIGDSFHRGVELPIDSPTGESLRYDTNTAALSVKYAFVDISKLQLDLSLTTLDYSDPRSRAESRLSAYFYYRVLPVTSAFVEYDFLSVAYDATTSVLDNDAHGGQLGATWQFSAISKGTAKAGFQAKNFSDSDVRDYSTWVASVELDHALTDIAHLRVVGGRRVNEAKYTGPSYYTTTELAGELTVWFLDRLAGIAKASIGRVEFSDPIVGDTEDRKDNMLSAGLGARYAFNYWLSLEADYSIVNRDSNIGAYSLTENAFSLRIKAAL